jgi:hypothetical protein
MSDSQMDEIFKYRLAGHESPVPDDMWERINRKKDEDRKGFFFFKLSGLFILGFGIAYFLLFGIYSSSVKLDGQKDSNREDKTIPAGTNVKAIDPNLAKSNSPGNETSQPGSDSLQNNHLYKTYTNNTDSIESAQKRLKQKNYTNSAHSIYPARNKYRQNTNTNSTGLKKKGPMEVQSNHSGIITGSQSTEGAAASNINNLPDQKATSTTSSVPNSFKADSANSTVAKNLDSAAKSLAADSLKKATAKKPDSLKKVVKGKWSLDLYASPDYPIVYGEPWVKTKLSYTTGLRINRSFGKRFSGKIGIQFSQINYNFTDSNGFSDPNHLVSLDLPVLAGYSWGDDTFGMTINTGVVFNLYSWLHSSSPSYFKTNTGLSLYLGFNVKKHISDRIDIFTEPYYRYRLSSMTVSSVYFTKFIDVAGLSFGARYHFKK